MNEESFGNGRLQKRQTALWMLIDDINKGQFFKDGEFSVYRTKEGVVVSRVNVFGIVLSKEKTDFVESINIEDGTGSISVKSFEKKDVFDKIDIGDVVNIIGKLREYNNSAFISCEIVIKSDQRAFLLRKKEIQLVKRFYKPVEEAQNLVDEETVGCVYDDNNKILELIRALDKGNGADINDIIEKSNFKNAEQILQNLIRNGDVFEISPGKIKILD